MSLTENSSEESWSEPVFDKLLRSPGIDSQPGGIVSLESTPWLLKRLQIRAQESGPIVYILYHTTLKSQLRGISVQW